MSYNIGLITSVIDADCILTNRDAEIKYLVTDSRRITFAASSLFFAIKTEHRDGASFLQDAYQQGIRNFVVQGKVAVQKYKGANFLIVKNVLFALQKLAKFHRSEFNYPVIGITGSNGKTIVKEWLYFLLNDAYKIVRSPRSYNSQIGVALSVWEMSEEYDLGIFEAGISEVKEMCNLQRIIQPQIGIITNIGDAHEKGFESKQQKLKEKINLFQYSKIVFANADDEQIIAALKEKTSAQVFSYGRSESAALRIIDIKKESKRTTIVGNYQGKAAIITIPFVDDASVQNACICWAATVYFNMDENIIHEKMLQLPAIDMRLQVLPAINNCTVINDSYTLDIDSLNVALDLLNQQLLSKTVILSDFYINEEKNYYSAVELLSGKKINRLITIGKNWQRYEEAFSDKMVSVELYESTNDFINRFQPSRFRNEAILLKGSRIFRFEEILNLLIEKVHQTRLEINLSNIVHNLKEYRKQLKPETKVMAMVKAFAYGSGSVEIASILQYHKIDYLAVAYADEGVELRNAGINIPIMVMNADEYGFETIVEHNLEPEIYSFKILNEFTAFLQKQGVSQFPVHLKIDTGMHRLGFEESQVNELITGLRINKCLIVKSVFSHLVGSEDAAEDDFTKIQTEVFVRCCDKIRHALQYEFIRHIANSAGIARHPDIQFDMVRLGIGLYGVNTTDKQLNLKTVASLKTTIAQIKHLLPGETVGYNRKGTIDKSASIATIRIGYADGYNRKFSNGVGFVLIAHQRAKVIGNIAMDMTMVDITGIPNVKEGDDVEVFGEHLPVQQLADWSGTIAYEIFTSIGQRVKRVYVEE